MNSENDLVKLELMKHVERAVRPVIASANTKMRMRRELLAHLLAAYEGELELDGNPSKAKELAVLRFGQQVELTNRLQKSVGHFEALCAQTQVRARRPHEPLLYYALHVAANYLVFTTGAVVLSALAGILFRLIVPGDPAIDINGLLRFLEISVILIVACPVSATAVVVINEFLRRITGESLWLWTLGWYISGALCLEIFFFVIYGWATGHALFVLNHPALVVLPGLVAPVMLAAGMLAFETARRKRAEWEELEIAG